MLSELAYYFVMLLFECLETVAFVSVDVIVLFIECDKLGNNVINTHLVINTFKCLKET